MGIKKQPFKKINVPLPVKDVEVDPLVDPEDLIVPDKDPDIIPDEDPFETPPYEDPEPGEGP